MQNTEEEGNGKDSVSRREDILGIAQQTKPRKFLNKLTPDWGNIGDGPKGFTRGM